LQKVRQVGTNRSDMLRALWEDVLKSFTIGDQRDYFSKWKCSNS